VTLNRSILVRAALLIALMANLTILSNKIQADTGSCGGATTTLPFTDVMGNPFFCQIASAYFSGLTAGTSATTYSPSQNVTREQMAAFTTRTLDQSLRRGSQRAVTKQWWVPVDADSLSLTEVGELPQAVEFDGTDLWVSNFNSDSVMRVRAGDGRLLDTWTGADTAFGVLPVMGRVFATGHTAPGKLFMIDPTQPAGTVTTLTSALGNNPVGLAFDGSRIWTANQGGSVSIVALNPTTVTNLTTGFDSPYGALFDGANIWVTDQGAGTLLKLNPNGTIAQTITVGTLPTIPVFDGTNIWVPNFASHSVTVVRVKDAQGNPLASAFVLANLTGNGLDSPLTAAFDGERILVTNLGATHVSLWKATDLTRLGAFTTGPKTSSNGACSDGLNFWITLGNMNKLARF
jgi:hypothetical protein